MPLDAFLARATRSLQAARVVHHHPRYGEWHGLAIPSSEMAKIKATNELSVGEGLLAGRLSNEQHRHIGKEFC